MSANQQDLSTAVVTGGSRGIRRAVAIALVRQGWNVCLSYNSNKKAADETLSGIHTVGRRALAVQADIANREDISRLFESAYKAFGRFDALVNKCRNCQRAAFDSGRGRRLPDRGFQHQCDRQFLSRQRGGLAPIGRAGTADEVAQVVAFHAGPLSSFMHGALVDGYGGR